MKRKFFVFLLAAVFCVNSMTVFAEGEKIEQGENTETGEVTETAQAENPEPEEREASEISDTTTDFRGNVPKIGGGVRQKKEL